ncbi:MAG: glycoside hydrolase family 16 protein [Chloroflexi bacterium]|nr:glycoside hydrolase family 16 protein [Chloroflexota bacterium]
MLTKLSSGDFPPNPLEKEGYRLEFHDEFDRPTLDTQKWLPYYLPHWSSRECSAPNYTLEHSNLVLQITQNQQPWCPEFDGPVRCSSIQTGTFSGPVGSKVGQHLFNKALVVKEEQANVQTYTPQYGYFELRAKGLNTSANLAALWMIGYEDLPERSGEIAVFELVGNRSGAEKSGVRYGVHPWGDSTLRDEFYEDYFAIDTTRYHIYGVEWTPSHIDHFIDNVKIKTIYQSPHYPMQFMLGIYELPFEDGWAGAYDPTDPYPKNFVIDYFRGYQPNDGYKA